MNQFSRLIHRLVEIQIKLCNRLLLILGVAMTLLILLQVFFRFVIYVPFPWSEECARYLMIWMGMLGSVIALHQGRHIGVTFFMERLHTCLRKPARGLTLAGMVLFLGILCWQGILFSLFNADQTSPALEIPMIIPFGAIPVGSLMMILVMLAEMLDLFFPGSKGPGTACLQPRETTP
jgi:TRAP-type C4-dicarboxylate transport system permease small subunit